MSKAPIEGPLRMWAPISVPQSRRQKTRFIHHYAIRSTRRAAREAYLHGWSDTSEAMLWVTIERVWISAIEPVQCVPTGACLLRER